MAAHEDFYAAVLVTDELSAFEGEVVALVNGWAESSACANGPDLCGPSSRYRR